jgi:hypothetical protein
MKLEFSRQIFEKYSKNFKKIPEVEAEFFHADGRTGRKTDRHDKADNRFSTFCLRA